MIVLMFLFLCFQTDLKEQYEQELARMRGILDRRYMSIKPLIYPIFVNTKLGFLHKRMQI